MSRLHLTRSAQADLIEMDRFTQARWGRPQARTCLRRVWLGLDRIRGNPALGRERRDLSAGLRSFPIARHVVFYREVETGIEILRILHGGMDPARHLDPNSGEGGPEP